MSDERVLHVHRDDRAGTDIDWTASFGYFNFRGLSAVIADLVVPVVEPFAVADQVGNAGGWIFAIALIAAGIGYATLVTLRPAP